MAGTHRKQRRARHFLPGAARVRATRANVPLSAPSAVTPGCPLSSPPPTHTVSCLFTPETKASVAGDSMHGALIDDVVSAVTTTSVTDGLAVSVNDKNDVPSIIEHPKPPTHAPTFLPALEPEEINTLLRSPTVLPAAARAGVGVAGSVVLDSHTIGPHPASQLASSESASRAPLSSEAALATISPSQSPPTQCAEVAAIAQNMHVPRERRVVNQRRHTRKRQPARLRTTDKMVAECHERQDARPTQVGIIHKAPSPDSVGLCIGAVSHEGERVAVAPLVTSCSAAAPRVMMSKTLQWQERRKVQPEKRRFFAELREVNPPAAPSTAKELPLQSAPIPPALAPTPATARATQEGHLSAIQATATSPPAQHAGTTCLVARARREGRTARRHRRNLVSSRPASSSPTSAGVDNARVTDRGGGDGVTPQKFEQPLSEAEGSMTMLSTSAASTRMEMLGAEFGARATSTLLNGETAQSKKMRHASHSTDACTARMTPVVAGAMAVIDSVVVCDKADTALSADLSHGAATAMQTSHSIEKGGAEKEGKCRQATDKVTAGLPSPSADWRHIDMTHQYVATSSEAQTLPTAATTPVTLQHEADKRLGTEPDLAESARGQRVYVRSDASNVTEISSSTAEPSRRVRAVKALRWLRRKAHNKPPSETATRVNMTTGQTHPATEYPTRATESSKCTTLRGHHCTTAPQDELNMAPSAKVTPAQEPPLTTACGARRATSAITKVPRRNSRASSVMTQSEAADDGVVAALAPAYATSHLPNSQKTLTQTKEVGAEKVTNVNNEHPNNAPSAVDTTTTLPEMSSTGCRDKGVHPFINHVQQSHVGNAGSMTTDTISSSAHVSNKETSQKVPPAQVFPDVTPLSKGSQSGEYSAVADADLQTASQVASRARRQANMARKLRRFRARWHGYGVTNEVKDVGIAFSPRLPTPVQERLGGTSHKEQTATISASDGAVCAAREVNSKVIDLVSSPATVSEVRHGLSRHSTLDVPMAMVAMNAAVSRKSSFNESAGRGETRSQDGVDTLTTQTLVHTSLPTVAATNVMHTETSSLRAVSGQEGTGRLCDSFEANVDTATAAATATLPVQLRRLSARQRIKRHVQTAQTRLSRSPQRVNIDIDEGVSSSADGAVVQAVKEELLNDVYGKKSGGETSATKGEVSASADLSDTARHHTRTGTSKSVMSAVSARPSISAGSETMPNVTPSTETQPFVIPDKQLSVDLFTPEEMILRRASLDDAWQLGLRFDWNERLLALRSLPGMSADDGCLQHPFVKLFRSRPAWYLQTVNGVSATHLTDVMNTLKCALQAHIIFRKP